MTQHIVAKFGGTSLADASQIQKVIQLIKENPQRRFIVVSAAGKRYPDDRKITDLLYLCHAHAVQHLSFKDIWHIITERYQSIVRELGLTLNLNSLLQEGADQIYEGASADYAASRGEYLMARILAEAVGFEFVNATRLIHFNDQGQLDTIKTIQAINTLTFNNANKGWVIPGFYGALPDGSIKTFSRGGSDITGALVARAVSAQVYENWTDVSGFLRADPRIIPEAEPMPIVTYQELRELSYMGANVLHDEAVFPVRQTNIPIHIRNTNEPDHPGTMIVGQPSETPNQHLVTGIAGKKGFTIIAIEKAMMNQEIGYARRVLSVLEANQVSFEHMPSGIDSLSLIIADSELEHKLPTLLKEIQQECRPDSIECHHNLALIATVGQKMARTPGIATRLFTALSKKGINIRMINQGSSEISIIIGVEHTDFEAAIQAIYDAFSNSPPS